MRFADALVGLPDLAMKRFRLHLPQHCQCVNQTTPSGFLVPKKVLFTVSAEASRVSGGMLVKPDT